MVNKELVSYRKLLKNDAESVLDELRLEFPDNKYIISYGSFYNDFIIGIVIIVDRTVKFEIIKLEVLPLFRDCGIGSGLVNFAEKELREIDNQKPLLTQYNSAQHNILKLSNFFIRNKWSTELYNYHIRIPVAEVPDFMNKREFEQIEVYLKEKQIDIIPLNMLSPVHIQSIENKKSNLEEYLYPFVVRKPFSDLSFFCIFQNEVIGWIMSEKCNSQELTINSIFIEKQYRRLDLCRIILNYIHKKAAQIFMNIKYYSFDYDHTDLILDRLYKLFFYKFYATKSEAYIAKKRF